MLTRTACTMSLCWEQSVGSESGITGNSGSSFTWSGNLGFLDHASLLGVDQASVGASWDQLNSRSHLVDNVDSLGASWQWWIWLGW
jgi:hypothetical protein